MEDYRELWQDEISLDFGDMDEQYAQQLVTDAEKAIKNYVDSLDAFSHSDMTKVVSGEVTDFVVGLGLPWPWLALELIEVFCVGVWGYPLGKAYTKEIKIEPENPLNIPPPVLQTSRLLKNPIRSFHAQRRAG